jgi:hypothetical protein
MVEILDRNAQELTIELSKLQESAAVFVCAQKAAPSQSLEDCMRTSNSDVAVNGEPLRDDVVNYECRPVASRHQERCKRNPTDDLCSRN